MFVVGMNSLWSSLSNISANTKLLIEIIILNLHTYICNATYRSHSVHISSSLCEIDDYFNVKYVRALEHAKSTRIEFEIKRKNHVKNPNGYEYCAVLLSVSQQWCCYFKNKKLQLCVSVQTQVYIHVERMRFNRHRFTAFIYGFISVCVCLLACFFFSHRIKPFVFEHNLPSISKATITVSIAYTNKFVQI